VGHLPRPTFTKTQAEGWLQELNVNILSGCDNVNVIWSSRGYNGSAAASSAATPTSTSSGPTAPATSSSASPEEGRVSQQLLYVLADASFVERGDARLAERGQQSLARRRHAVSP